MENLWDCLRNNQLSQRGWDPYDAMPQPSAETWRFLRSDPERSGSIAARSRACLLTRAGIGA
jgi:hypothetical protein